MWNVPCGMFNLVEESVECYVEGQRVEMENEWFLNHIARKPQLKIVRIDITMSLAKVSFRNNNHTRSMVRLIICYNQE